MVTNLSEADLVYKDPATLDAITAHKADKTMKSCIKPFKIDNNQLTGLKNFTEICKEPLTLPSYALPESAVTSSTTQS